MCGTCSATARRSRPSATRSTARSTGTGATRSMRTHTALHVLCGVIWNEWSTAVTGGNMEPLSARMDFEFDPLPEGFGARVEELVNAELEADRPIEVSFLPAWHRARGRRPDPHQGQPDPRVGPRDPGRRHRGPRQAGRRRHPRGQHRGGRPHQGGEDRVEGQGQQAHPPGSSGCVTVLDFDARSRSLTLRYVAPASPMPGAHRSRAAPPGGRPQRYSRPLGPFRTGSRWSG